MLLREEYPNRKGMLVFRNLTTKSIKIELRNRDMVSGDKFETMLFLSEYKKSI